MSRQFTDNAARAWKIELNVWAVKRVRDLLHVDLLDLDGGAAEEPGKGLLFRLIADPVLLVDVVYVVCREQAETLGITDEKFGRAMAGDAIDGATKAFLEELADFTPSPRDRARARKVIEATWTLIDRAQDVMDGQADAAMAKAADAAMRALSGPPPVPGSALGSSSGSSPASSESIPDP